MYSAKHLNADVWWESILKHMCVGKHLKTQVFGDSTFKQVSLGTALAGWLAGLGGCFPIHQKIKV